MRETTVIFPTNYVCEKSNFDYQEFCVLNKGFSDPFEDPGLEIPDFKPDKVLDNSKYNDRDIGVFTAEEKKAILKDNPKGVFKKYAWVAFPVDVDWEAGHKYTYVLDFSNGLGIEPPNGIYGGRLISDIIKLFDEQEANSKQTKSKSRMSSKTSRTQQKKKFVKLPSGTGTVKMESSGKWTGGVIVK